MCKSTKLREVHREFEWDKWIEEIPYIQFNNDWLVRAIPPNGNGIIRYHIKHKNNPNSHVSIYLDCYNMLGYMDGPYWELYADGYDSDDCFRCMINETDELLAAIEKSLESQ